MPELLAVLRDRRARRAFDSRPVLEDVQDALWQAVAVAPSHANAQPTRVLVADSPHVRQQLIEALSDGNRQWAPAAPLLFALLANPSHDSAPRNRDGSQRELWAFHAGIAAGNLMAQATACGLVAHPMAGFDEEAVRAAFGVPDDLRVITIFAAGYPGTTESLPADLQRRETDPQERLPLTHLVGHDAWNAEMGVSARGLRGRRS